MRQVIISGGVTRVLPDPSDSAAFIPVSFRDGSGGWGLLIEAGCAMKFHGQENSFTFELDAVESMSYAVIRGKDCGNTGCRISRKSVRSCSPAAAGPIQAPWAHLSGPAISRRAGRHDAVGGGDPRAPDPSGRYGNGPASPLLQRSSVPRFSVTFHPCPGLELYLFFIAVSCKKTEKLLCFRLISDRIEPENRR